MAVLKLDSRTDFRLEKMAGSATYHVPADAGAAGGRSPSAFRDA